MNTVVAVAEVAAISSAAGSIGRHLTDCSDEDWHLVNDCSNAIVASFVMDY